MNPGIKGKDFFEVSRRDLISLREKMNTLGEILGGFVDGRLRDGDTPNATKFLRDYMTQTFDEGLFKKIGL